VAGSGGFRDRPSRPWRLNRQGRRGRINGVASRHLLRADTFTGTASVTSPVGDALALTRWHAAVCGRSISVHAQSTLRAADRHDDARHGQDNFGSAFARFALPFCTCAERLLQHLDRRLNLHQPH
jgi:hypothetical protein